MFKRVCFFSVVLFLCVQNYTLSYCSAATATAGATASIRVKKYPVSNKPELTNTIRGILKKYIFADFIKKDLETIIVSTYDKQMYDIVDRQLEALDNLQGYGVHIVGENSPPEIKAIFSRANGEILKGQFNKDGILINANHYSIGILAHEFAHAYLSGMYSDIFPDVVVMLMNEGKTDYHVREILDDIRENEYIGFDNKYNYYIPQYEKASGSYSGGTNAIAVCDLLLKNDSVINYLNHNVRLEDLFFEIEKDNPGFIDEVLPNYLFSLSYNYYSKKTEIDLSQSKNKFLNSRKYDFTKFLSNYNAITKRNPTRINVLLEANEILRQKFIGAIFDNVASAKEFAKREAKYLIYKENVALYLLTDDGTFSAVPVDIFPSFKILDDKYQILKEQYTGKLLVYK